MSHKNPKSVNSEAATYNSSEKKSDQISFCFRNLESASYKKCKDHKFFINFMERLKKLGEIGWNQIQINGRHEYGREFINVSQIKPKLPKIITEDVKKLMVFRATSDNYAFLGIRRDNVFCVIFIETTFGDIYDHG